MAEVRFQKMPLNSRTAVVRFYPNENSPPLADYQVVCTVNWESDTVVWVHGLMGAGSRAMWRAFVACLHQHGVEQIRATRAEGRVLPRAKPHPSGHGLVLHVADLVRQPPDSGFVAL